MRLDEYEWSRNPRGMHVASIFQSPPDYSRYTNPRFGWVKLLAAGTEYVDDVQTFLSAGITPIVRLYLGRFGAGPFDRSLQRITTEFARAGVRWFEFYNEPNLDVEWPEGVDPTWEDQVNIIRPLMENWLNFAEFVVSLGCYPGFIALAESVNYRYATKLWMEAFFNYLGEFQFDRFQQLLANGMYCATHPYIFNHYYQEVAGGGPLTARPMHLQNAREGGWHFEYPYDPICQANDPGRSVYGGTELSPYGDPNGLIAVGRLFNELAASMFGSAAVPVVGTEGGIWPFRNQQFQQDTRYPPYNIDSQAQGTVAMFEWIAREAPPWFFGVCLWKEDEYYDGGTAPAIHLLEQTAPVLKTVPSIQVMSDNWMRINRPGELPGPAPIQGRANLHMVILGPGIDLSWFMDTGQAYWNHFRPIVTTLPQLMELVPDDKSLAVTLLATDVILQNMRDEINKRYPNVWVDTIATTNTEQVRNIFNDRVNRNLRFG